MSDVILCGVGGQGTVLASKLIARAAMVAGRAVKTAETIGMAQRGGSVVSHVRVGDGGASPLISRGRADLIIGFEPAEAARQLSYLRACGTVVVSDRAVIPVSATVGGPAYAYGAIMGYLANNAATLVVVDAAAAARELRSARVLNVVLLGAAAKTGTLGLGMGELRDAVRELVATRFVDINLRALALGAACAQAALNKPS